MGAHRKRRFRRFRLPVIGLAIAVTLSTGATIAIAREGERRPAVTESPARVPTFSYRVPETAAGRHRDTTLVVAAQPAAVAVGRATTLTATLTSVDTGRPLAGRDVEVYSRRRGADRRLIVRMRTDAAGRIRLTGKPPKHTVYDFVYAGGGGYRAASSRRLPVAVTPRLGMKRSHAKVPSGYVVTFRGSVSPARPGQLVHLQVKGLTGWRTIRSKPVSRTGVFTIPLKAGPPGRYLYRAYTLSRALDPGVTKELDVSVASDVAGSRGVGSTRRVSSADPLRVLVTGDSLAYWLGEELRTDSRSRARTRTRVESRHSTGLARPEYFDWHARAAAQAHDLRPEAVVVWIGGNDCQPMRTPGGRWVPTGSRAWQAEYTRRAVLVMRAYAGRGRRVYWVGMPTARPADINACFRAMTAATRQAAVQVPGTTWVDTVAMFSGPDGRYTETIRGVQVRGEDGIHLNRVGSRVLARRVLSLMHADWRVYG